MDRHPTGAAEMSVVTMRSQLTEADVRALVKAPNEQERAAAAEKICARVDRAVLSPEERVHAEAILRLMAEDAVVQVRRALAVTLRASPKLPRDIARALARDVEAVALPVLEHSPALSDQDLLELLAVAPFAKQMAIAGRETLSTAVTDVLAKRGAPEVVKKALANEGAEFAEEGLNTVLSRFGGNESITGQMARRNKLPTRVAEKLIALVSGEMFDYLINHHELPAQVAIDLASGARERATLDLVEQAGRQQDLASFAHQLNVHGRLTPSFIMRAVCLGQIAFIEYALAELARVPHQRAWLLVHDSGPLGLRTLFDRAGLPVRLFAPFRAAIDLHHQLEQEGMTDNPLIFRQRMVERALTLFQSIPKDDLDYLLDKLDATSKRVRSMASASPGKST